MRTGPISAEDTCFRSGAGVDMPDAASQSVRQKH